MKKLIILFLLVTGNVCYSQTKEKPIFDCDDLQSIFANPYFAKIFIPKTKDTVIFVDTIKVFNCNGLTIHEQPVLLLDTLTAEISHKDFSDWYIQQARRIKPSEKRYCVIISFKKETKHRYNFELWQPQNNSLWRTYLYKGRKTRFKIYYDGAF